MKKLFIIFIVYHLSFIDTYAQQNLVPNWSFEDTIMCPYGYGFNGYVADWTGQGRSGQGLDYFTGQCPKASLDIGVPQNSIGYQYACSGVSYAGIDCYLSYYSGNPNYYDFRNYLQVQLFSQLKAGSKYYVEFFVALGDTEKYVCNDIGAYLSDSLIYYSSTFRVKSYLTPQIANNPVTNPLNIKEKWIPISGCFVAQGGEQYIVIGNFKGDDSSSIDSVGSKASNSYLDVFSAFYYIDCVSVREIIKASASTFKKDTEICNGESLLIGDTAVPGVSYSWHPTTGLSNPNAAQTYASPTVTTTYTLTVKNDSISGCACADSISTDTVTIRVCPPPPPLENNIFIPSAFSPNGDGQNDILLPKGNNVATLYMAIFDRWGNKVFESENINEGWDGNYKGKPCETATYSYYANGSYEDGKMFSTKGNVTLVR